MYCKNCGAEIDDKAVVCPHCGVATGKATDNKASGMSIAALVCAFFIPLLGWIFGGIGLKNAENKKSKSLSTAGIIVATVMFVINLLFLF